MNDFFALGPTAWQALRHGLFARLESPATGAAADAAVEALRGFLVPQAEVEYTVPARIGDYTDFYTSVHHAANIGKLFRGGDDVLTPNFKWIPIGYHGRASSIGVSGQTFHRPMGQAMAQGASLPVFGPCARLDYELDRRARHPARGLARDRRAPRSRGREHGLHAHQLPAPVLVDRAPEGLVREAGAGPHRVRGKPRAGLARDRLNSVGRAARDSAACCTAPRGAPGSSWFLQR